MKRLAMMFAFAAMLLVSCSSNQTPSTSAVSQDSTVTTATGATGSTGTVSVDTAKAKVDTTVKTK